MSGSGESVVRLRLTVSSAALMLALALTCLLAGPASAAGPAKAGSTFATSFLNLPAKAIPGSDSGFVLDSVERSALSADGRFVAFVSVANSLSRAANPNVSNIFRKDRLTGSVVLVSRKTGKSGTGATRGSREPRISADGKVVTFLTKAALVPGDVDGAEDVYLRNLTTGVSTLATPNTSGIVFQHDLSSDGEFIAFASPEALVGTDNNNDPDVFRRNLDSGVIDLVSRIQVSETAGDDYSDSPSISGDGRWIAFRSNATNLFGGFNNANGAAPDVFVRNMSGLETRLVSAQAGNLNAGGNGESGEPAIAGTPAASAEVKVAYGSFSTNVAAGGVDLSAASSVYLRSSLAAAPSTLVSQSTGGENADSRAHTPTISDTGNRILFSSDAGNLGAGSDYYGSYLRDVGAGTTTLGSARNEYAIAGDISGNGNLITWMEAGGATPDSDPDANGIFARPIPGGAVQFVSRPKGSQPFLNPGAAVGTPPDGARTISSNGRFVVFALYSSRLGAAPNQEIFRRDLSNGRLALVSRKSGKTGQKSGGAFGASVSNSGARVAFISFAPLVPADTDDKSDAYVRDLNTNTTTLVSRADGPAGADANEFIESVAISGDGRRVVFATDASNLGVAGGLTQVFVRDIEADTTTFVSKATGPGGVAGNNNSGNPGISNNGQAVVFRSSASNLDPEDPNPSLDIYVRNLATNTLLLVSRGPGLAGAVSTESEFYAAISGDGKVVAFNTIEENLVPGSGPWPLDVSQVVSRVLATGSNSLVSRSGGGSVANGQSWSPSLNRDGSIVAFDSTATNLLAGRGGESRPAVLVRNMKTGRFSGPPAFGLTDSQPQGSRSASLSDNGRCLTFTGFGYNRSSGDLSDLFSSYVYVVSGTCSNPRGLPKPKLSKVAARASSIRFRLNARATVKISFERKRAGGFKAAGKVVRKNQKAGRNTFRYRGKVGKRRLAPGTYRVTLVAKNASGSSKKVRKTLKIRR